MAGPIITRTSSGLDRSSIDRLLMGHTSGLNAVAFSPDSRFLATAGHDEKVRVWNASTGQLLLGLEGHGGLVNSVAYSPCKRRIATASCDSTVRLWDASDGKPLSTMQGHSSWVFSAVFDHKGNRIASAGGDRKVIVWDARSGGKLLSINAHEYGVRSVAFSPDGKWLASGGSFDTNLRIWDARQGKLVQTLGGHKDGVNGLGYNHDGRHLVSAGQDKAPRIWCLQKLKPILTLKGHRKTVLGLAVSTNGRRIATVSKDNTARIWCIDFGDLKQTLVGHTCKVWSAAFSPDGKRVATVSADGTSAVWEPNSGVRLLTLAGKEDVTKATGKAGSRTSSPLRRIDNEQPGAAAGLITDREEALEAATIEKLKKKLRQRDEEIKMLKGQIGQAGPGPPGLGLETAVQSLGSKTTDKRTVEFPSELNNLDYIRRVLSNITLSLRPVYRLVVEAGGCEKARDHFTGEVVEWDRASCFEMVHHIRAHAGRYLQPDALSGMQEEDLAQLERWVEEARSDLASPEEAPPQRMTDNYVLATMYWAKDIATFARARFALDNLNDLIRRFQAHAESREARRQAMSSRAIVSRSMAIEQQMQSPRRSGAPADLPLPR